MNKYVELDDFLSTFIALARHRMLRFVYHNLLQIPAIQGSISISRFWHGPCRNKKEVDQTEIENRIPDFLGVAGISRLLLSNFVGVARF